MTLKPPPLRGSDAASFAERTILQRQPALLDRLIAENRFSAAICANIKALNRDLTAGEVRYLKDTTAPDAGIWRELIDPYLGQSWLRVPWLFEEFYFYRRILEATGYFGAGATAGIDPFAQQKRLEWAEAAETIAQIGEKLAAWQTEPGGLREQTIELLYGSLWGNQGDLSMWAAGSAEMPQSQTKANQGNYLLADDAGILANWLVSSAQPLPRLDFIADNSGRELAADLALIDFLITRKLADQVWLHLKTQPTFVSDAAISDAQQTIARLAKFPDKPVVDWGNRLGRAIAEERLIFAEPPFWTTPRPFWEMPATLRQSLAASSLIISKGDANYRRALGDLHWAFDQPYAEIVDYMPARFAALRTLKSEVAAGISPSQQARAAAIDPSWLISGKWGVIQTVD